jgi:hypothetical protein
MSLLISTLLDRVQKEFANPEVEWENGEINEEDLKFLNEECNKDSEFDPLNKRRSMYNSMIRGRAYKTISVCEYGQIFAIFENMDQIAQLPWGLWGRILRMFSEKCRRPFKVFFLANTHLREFPSGNNPINRININGGYTYKCNPETIVIYRAEDATRVLIHELQHACCLDKDVNSIDTIEAETEAWAELFYIAFLSRGKKFIFDDMLKRQSEWMRKQNKKVRKHMANPNSEEFPWRYTIGKEEVWRRWNILSEVDLKPEIKIGNSLRLTYPPNTLLKEHFNVLKDSTIL